MPRFNTLEALPSAPASDVKRIGWRGLMKAVDQQGLMVVTNHGEPDAVILSTETYEAMLQLVRDVETRRDDALATLRRRFDERLTALHAADAGDRLRTLMDTPVQLDGKVKAGTGF